MGKPSVAIVVPVYRPCFNQLEWVSWAQLHRILGHFPVCIATSEHLKNCFPKDFWVESFSDRYFQSVESYSRFMLEPDLYRRLSAYEYILVYQLDAFVFSDRLSYFCSLGYDYIGAPLPRWADFWHGIKARVGNGGLSLRRTHAMLRILKEKGHLLRDHPMSADFLRYEDLFFGYCGILPDGIRVPDAATALLFSVENRVSHCYQKISAGGSLPFGCHAWEKADYPFWKPRIESYGYVLPDDAGSRMAIRYRKTMLQRYLLERVARICHRDRAAKAVRKVLSGDGYAIWGYGKDGRRLLRLLRSTGISVDCIMDRACSGREFRHGILFCKPSPEIFSAYRGRTLLGSWEYEDAMAKDLVGHGMRESIDFWKFSELVDTILSVYYGSL